MKTNEKKSIRVIGFDPGYDRLGIAVVETVSGKQFLIFSDCLETNKKDSISKRITFLGKKIGEIISEYKPDTASLETLFFNINQKTGIAVAEMRGVILYECEKNGLKIKEFSPQEVKIAVTGYGKSDKKSMINMVPKIIKVVKKIKHDDEFDAIAVAIVGSVSK